MTEGPTKGGGITCRRATPADQAAVAELFWLCDRHYGQNLAPTREEMAAHIQRRVMARESNIEILLAEAKGKAIGFATFAVLYPAPSLGGQLFLKDLFVNEDLRNGGVGPALLRTLARIALERGCVRLDWTAESDNPRALAFYDRIGARRLSEKVYFRFDGAALKAFAEGE